MADNNNAYDEWMDDETVIYKERKRWLFLGLPWTFTKYTITQSMLTIDHGLFNTIEDDCYLYKIQDVKLNISLWERLAGLGTIVCYTGDATHPELRMEHISNAKEIKNYIFKQSEICRMKRRTLNTMDIGAHTADFDNDEMMDSSH